MHKYLDEHYPLTPMLTTSDFNTVGCTAALLKLVRTPLNVLLRGFSNYISLSLYIYAPITSDECHALFYLNAASPAARNTEQVNITKNLVHGRIRTTNTARPSKEHGLLPHHIARTLTARRICLGHSISSILI